MSAPPSSSASAPHDWQLLPQDYQGEILAYAMSVLPHSEGAPPTLLSLSERNPEELKTAIEAVAKSKLEAFRSEQDRLGTAPQFTITEIEASDNPLLTLSINAEIRRWVNEAPAGEGRNEAAARILGWIKNPSDRLDLGSLDLSTLPDIFHHPAFKNLEELDLQANSLTPLPESFGNLAGLHSLVLGSYLPTSLPESIGNQLTTLPESIGSLTTLQDLNLSGNKLRALPESIGSLTALKNLNLRGNQLTTLPESICKLTALERLDLSGNQLMALPESIGNLTALHNLHLQNNQLTALPESIGNLAALQSLNLSGNQLRALPDSIGNLAALKHLDLGSNQLTTLPESFGRLTALERLYLNNNQLTTLPESICNLAVLESLGLSSNQLTTLPESFGNLAALKRLNLCGNPLTALPESIGNLAVLEFLDLSDTRLTGLPNSLLHGSISQRCVIYLENAPLSPHVRTALHAAVSLPTYRGPRLHFSMSIAPPAPEGRPLGTLLHELYEVAGQGDKMAELDAELSPLLALSKERKESLAMWLGRLSETADYRAKGEQQKKLATVVLSYLQFAAINPEFREGTFTTIVSEACETCGDRVAYSILQVGLAMRRKEAAKKEDPRALADFLLGDHAIEILYNISQAKVLLMPFVDQIEVYLIYPTKLKERLGLPIDIDSMLYPACSNVSQKELGEAAAQVEAEVSNLEKRLEYLASQGDWLNLVARHPATRERYKAIREVREKRESEALDIEDSALRAHLYQQIENDYKKALLDLSEDLLKA